MKHLFEGLEPELLWKHFDMFLKIPHCSGNEQALGDYILDVAERNNLPSKRDKTGNVVVEKKASPGHEEAETVILQGHLDMVCEKNSDVVHDFSKDPIKAEIKWDWVQAVGTTLGSDNGIGLAASLAVLEDRTLVHGPLECLFTVDEETGLTGATKLEPGFLKGKKMLNLDSEEEGTFTIGCAGGADTEIILPLQRTEQTGKEEAFRLKLFGFRGGHSGLDIHQGRGNAIKLLARLLWQAGKDLPFHLVHMEGGNKRNAIAREAWADLLLEPGTRDTLADFMKKAFGKIQVEYEAVEKEAQFSLDKQEMPASKPLTSPSREILINLILAMPHGVIAMHPEIKDLVETSTNLGIIRTRDEDAQIICSTRSSIASALEAARNMIRALCDLAGAQANQPDGYPGWMPNLQSPLLKTLKEVYKKVFDKEPHVAAVHAGLECGIIGEKFPGMDMISFGPTIQNPHSPEERVHIDSVNQFWKFLTAVLEELS